MKQNPELKCIPLYTKVVYTDTILQRYARIEYLTVCVFRLLAAK